MKLREYEYILAIAREKNMVRAAQYLCVSQPALSRLLASVEAEMGVQLFRRCGREMVPTQAGRAYLNHAKRIVELNEQLECQMKQIVSGSKQITIACPAIRNHYLISNVLPTVRKEMPDIQVEIQNTAQQNLMNALNKGNASLAFGVVDDEYENKLAYRLIGTEEMVLAVCKGHPLLGKAERNKQTAYPYIRPELLAQECFVMSRPDAYSTRYARNYFEANHISPPIVMQAPLTGTLITAVAGGIGSAILPSIPLNGTVFQDSIRYCSITDDADGQAVGVMFRKERELTQEEKRMIQIIRESYQAR